MEVVQYEADLFVGDGSVDDDGDSGDERNASVR